MYMINYMTGYKREKDINEDFFLVGIS